jgi:hypothetical protein
MVRYRNSKPEEYQPLHPSTWLNQKRFLDEPEAVPVPPKHLLVTAWKAAGLNGAGPPPWKVLADGANAGLLTQLCAAHHPLKLLVDGIRECVQQIQTKP